MKPAFQIHMPNAFYFMEKGAMSLSSLCQYRYLLWRKQRFWKGAPLTKEGTRLMCQSKNFEKRVWSLLFLSYKSNRGLGPLLPSLPKSTTISKSFSFMLAFCGITVLVLCSFKGAFIVERRLIPNSET